MSGPRQRPTGKPQGPTQVDLAARLPQGTLVQEAQEPATPVSVEVQSIEPLTGSLPVLTETVAAIESERERGKHVERTTAEQRRDDMEAELRSIGRWWKTMTERDIAECIPKALEYGSGDLEMMGHAMLQLQGDVWEGGDAGEKTAVGMELAVLFYIHGKLSRAMAAAKNGQRASDDTIKDIRIYAVMLQHIRDFGRWV